MLLSFYKPGIHASAFGYLLMLGAVLRCTTTLLLNESNINSDSTSHTAVHDTKAVNDNRHRLPASVIVANDIAKFGEKHVSILQASTSCNLITDTLLGDIA